MKSGCECLLSFYEMHKPSWSLEANSKCIFNQQSYRLTPFLFQPTEASIFLFKKLRGEKQFNLRHMPIFVKGTLVFSVYTLVQHFSVMFPEGLIGASISKNHVNRLY